MTPATSTPSATPASDLLTALRARYAAMTSYRDRGVVRVWRPGDLPPLEMTFVTHFRAPNQWRFGFVYPHPMASQPGTHYIVGCDGARSYLYTRFPEQRAQLSEFPTLARALGAASGISCGSAQTIAHLLLRDLRGASIADLTDVQHLGICDIGTQRCHRLSGQQRHGGPQELAIGQQDGLLHRFVKRSAGLQVEELRERIDVNVAIDPREFSVPA